MSYVPREREIDMYSIPSVTSSSIKTTVLNPATFHGESNSQCMMTIRSLTHIENLMLNKI